MSQRRTEQEVQAHPEGRQVYVLMTTLAQTLNNLRLTGTEHDIIRKAIYQTTDGLLDVVMQPQPVDNSLPHADVDE